MQTSDLPIFEEIIKRLEKVFGKEIDDETMEAYWGALKDQPLAMFRKLADHHIRNGKFFPKPFELRPKEERGVVRDKTSDDAFREAEDRCIRNLEELRQQNPDQWLLRMGDNNAARLHQQFKGNIWYDLQNRCWRNS
jgi:hypothetical protein